MVASLSAEINELAVATADLYASLSLEQETDKLCIFKEIKTALNNLIDTQTLGFEDSKKKWNEELDDLENTILQVEDDLVFQEKKSMAEDEKFGIMKQIVSLEEENTRLTDKARVVSEQHQLCQQIADVFSEFEVLIADLSTGIQLSNDLGSMPIQDIFKEDQCQRIFALRGKISGMFSHPDLQHLCPRAVVSAQGVKTDAGEEDLERPGFHYQQELSKLVQILSSNDIVKEIQRFRRNNNAQIYHEFYQSLPRAYRPGHPNIQFSTKSMAGEVKITIKSEKGTRMCNVASETSPTSDYFMKNTIWSMFE